MVVVEVRIEVEVVAVAVVEVALAVVTGVEYISVVVLISGVAVLEWSNFSWDKHLLA